MQHPPALAGRVGPAALLAVAVVVTAAIPLLYDRWFFYWDDSAAAFTPGWRVIGQELLDGRWPALVPEMWAGGNVTAEALYGIYNPVLLAAAVVIALVPNLAVGITLVKMFFLAVLAVGTYVLARQFGASRPMAFTAGYVMPFATYTLYFDASSWASGLIAFAWIPHVFWSVRASAHGRINPLWAILFSALALTTGNPYGAVGVVVVYLAVGVELLRHRGPRALSSMVVTGLSALLMSIVVYLPLAFTTGVSVRTATGVTNDGMLRPGLGDILDLSNPTRLPMIDSFGDPFLTMPVGYLAWFVVPLLPWMRWRTMRTSLAGASSLVVFFGVYAVLLLGPSQLWLFRWPLRLLEYAQLPVIVVVAVVLSAGLERDRLRLRAGLTALLVAFQFYTAWSSVPEDLGYHATALGVVAVLTALVLIVRAADARIHAAVFAAGTATILALQTTLWFPGNYTVTPWFFPRQASFTADRFADRYVGNTFAIADTENIPLDQPRSQWGDLVFGNQWQAAGVDAVNSYAGISYADFVEALCLNYYGGVQCSDAVDRLERTAPGTTVSWIDALRLQTIVVQNSGPYGGPRAFDGLSPTDWTVIDGPIVTVARRTTPLPFPDGRVSATAAGLEVQDDVTTSPTRESLRYSGSGAVTFAMLAWPGWSATVDGRPVEVDATSGGLLQIDLPAASANGSTVDLAYTPPGQSLGVSAAAAGVLLALAHSVLWSVRRRRATPDVRPEAVETGSP
ncbi:hypothetical protein [Rhodococcoides corynebacterioides]|uniref:hypothetical protein n=1 Tax=Rhodococcoides corynebacterioides TaxID=53972 RepID=UPI000830B1C6|nr:hypothetical protein [Rhodococcus corynebacterioides]